MLVLSRKSQESVVVGGSIGGKFEFKVTVMEVKAGKVRLGFDADPHVQVHRGEVWERIRSGIVGSTPRSSPNGTSPNSLCPASPGAAVRKISSAGGRNI